MQAKASVISSEKSISFLADNSFCYVKRESEKLMKQLEDQRRKNKIATVNLQNSNNQAL